MGKDNPANDFSLPDILIPYPLSQPHSRWKKRLLDIVGALFIIIFILTWLIPILAVLLLIDGGKPIFFLQKRVGHNNKVFCCFKLRTMNKSSANETEKISKLGWVLRYLKLDETPQFFNVLKGEMSLVGPRPHTLEDHFDFKDRIGSRYELRQQVKPGITGLAQINGYEGPVNSAEKLIGRVNYDLKYINIWSIGLDIKIMGQTVLYILKLFFKKLFNN